MVQTTAYAAERLIIKKTNFKIKDIKTYLKQLMTFSWACLVFYVDYWSSGLLVMRAK